MNPYDLQEVSDFLAERDKAPGRRRGAPIRVPSPVPGSDGQAITELVRWATAAVEALVLSGGHLIIANGLRNAIAYVRKSRPDMP